MLFLKSPSFTEGLFFMSFCFYQRSGIMSVEVLIVRETYF